MLQLPYAMLAGMTTGYQLCKESFPAANLNASTLNLAVPQYFIFWPTSRIYAHAHTHNPHNPHESQYNRKHTLISLNVTERRVHGWHANRPIAATLRATARDCARVSEKTASLCKDISFEQHARCCDAPSPAIPDPIG